MSAIPMPNAADVNIGGSLLAVEWSLAGVAGLVLGLRMFSVTCILHRVQAADYLMLLAFICAVVQGILLTAAYHWGLGRHFYYLNTEERIHAVKYAFLLQGWGIASPTFGRISFCAFMLDFVLYNKIIKNILWFSIILQVLVNVATIVVVYSQCGSHPAALWDPSIHAHCWSPSLQTNFSYFQGAWNSFTDLYLTIIPAVLLRALRIALIKKLTIIFLLSLNILAFVTSVVKAIKIKELSDRGDFTWALVELHYWAVSENYVVIIAASVPLLYVLINRSRQMTSSSESYRLSVSRRKSVPTENVYVITKDASHAWENDGGTTDNSRKQILTIEESDHLADGRHINVV